MNQNIVYSMNELKQLVNELTQNHPKAEIDRIDNIMQEIN